MLDTEKLRRLQTLMARGATEGERSAARGRAEMLAQRAGLSLSDALSKLDEQPAAKPKGMFDGFDDWMEAKEPGWKARSAAERAQREAARLKRCEELLREFGSEEAVFAETAEEAALRKALAPLADKTKGFSGFDGWVSGRPTEAMWQAMGAALPFPETAQGALDELRGLEGLTDARCAFFPDYSEGDHVYARISALTALLDGMSDPTEAGIRARLKWIAAVAHSEIARDPGFDQELAATLQADFELFTRSRGKNTRRASRAERQTEIVSMLRAHPDLPDREIARRIGCSPQTAGNWRRRLAKGHS
ncbi:helix-turn-helix domain-containing protein [Oceanicola sp. S124]|uniref:helix-turn-helix domain-containing protein n=1 Tax=Oceanicola sp. S124 TaxID=1042378 RepID=UPI000255900E|nr:helix-turn-helix domain-containing protein [Oceanicola sp. S124]